MKFVWQISDPPLIFMTSNVVANVFHKYLEPHIVGRFGHIVEGLPIGPQWTNLKIFQFFLTQNPISIFLWKKLPTYVFEAPFAGRFEKWGVCQSAQNWPVGKFFNFLPHKIRIKRGSVLWKKLLTHVFGALQCRPF